MSAPPSGSSGSSPSPSSPSPAPGYYPDPSIPNYIRYWNGSAWVPGTSRPAPLDTTPEQAAGGSGAAAATAWPAAAGSVPGPPAAPARPDADRAADESGPMFLDEDPRAPRSDSGPGVPAQGGAPGGAAPDPRAADGQGGAPAWPSMDRPGTQLPRISWGAEQAAAAGRGTQSAAQEPQAGQAAPAAGSAQAASAAPSAPSARPAQHAQAAQPSPPAVPAVPHQVQPQSVPQEWPEQAGPSAQPARSGQGAAAERPAAPWAAQVHDLAQPPWRPVPSDPFGASQRQDRPGGLVRRFAARVIDGVLLAALTGAAAVPLGTAAYHHAKDKVDQAKLTGETVKVWLLDGTTGAELAAVVGVLLVAGLLLEVLPNARWGRTLGKKLVGLRVLDIDSQLPPGFGVSLRRWATRTLFDLTVVGLLASAWGLFDRPWKQGLHDKAARTFVAGD
ncbi:Uncharacterized membrane protein YckC, RDD family [Actinacidiphila rubida]|uniref:Uncharacterized membrane protein YckC, RDD family n=3 Tax=Actinacidiphila rubida TaxID=310780 RepID=A0A1H8HW19_9ACTN|nr:RDD family protein [Actinacidiphila rubida]SEN60175.1 Uncharacterized membrane protein YckC, RDD family [Actinacidiphila rubida]